MSAHVVIQNFFGSVIVPKLDDSEEMSIDTDKSKYWQRVKTFSILRWTAKPNCLSPIICARFGWENIKPNLLRCVSCKKILSATLPDAWEDYYDKALRKLVDMLITHHEDYCSWKFNPTPHYIYALPHTLDNDSSAIRYFEDAIHTLSKMKHLPKLNIKFLDQTGASITELKHVYARLYEGVATSHVSRIEFGVREMTLCALAICGWTKLDKYEDILECKYCQRHAGLWNYATVESQKNLNGIKVKSVESDANGKASAITCNHASAVKRRATPDVENGAGEATLLSCGKRLKIAHVAPMPNGHSSTLRNVVGVSEKPQSMDDLPLFGAGDEACPATNVNECLKVLPTDTFCDNAFKDNSSEGSKTFDSNDSHSSEDLPLITYTKKSPSKKSENKAANLDITDDEVCTDIVENLIDQISGEKPGQISTNQTPDEPNFAIETHEQNGKIDDGTSAHKMESESSLNHIEDFTPSPRSCSAESVQMVEEDVNQQVNGQQTDQSQSVNHIDVKVGKRTRLVSYESSEELNAMLKDDDSIQAFDPLSQHRSWCPWACKQDENPPYPKFRNIGAHAFYQDLRYLAHKATQ